MTVYLYVKQHSVTGLKYFGKTTRADPHSYLGSGIYWKRHIKQHGVGHVVTTELWSFDDTEECQQFALEFSNNHNIVESTEWANLVAENGVDGYLPGVPRSAETREKISLKQKQHAQNYSDEYKAKLQNNFTSSQVRQKLSAAARNRTQTQDVKEKISQSLKNKPKPRSTCVICGAEASLANIARWHNSHCKQR
jgi:hypothetical protein